MVASKHKSFYNTGAFLILMLAYYRRLLDNMRVNPSSSVRREEDRTLRER
jgi:hypothetical protein